MIVRHLFFFSLCNKTQSSWTYKSLGFYLFINSSSKLQYWHPNFPTILNYIGPEQHPNSFRFVFVFCNRLPELQVRRQSVTFRHDIQTSLSLLELHVWRKRPPLPRYQLLSSVCWSIFDIWTSLRPCPQVLTAAATLRDLQWKHLGFGFMYFFFFFSSRPKDECFKWGQQDVGQRSQDRIWFKRSLSFSEFKQISTPVRLADGPSGTPIIFHSSSIIASSCISFWEA